MASYKRSRFLTDKPFHYCPGCTHGTVHRIIADVLQELTEPSQVIGVASVGCSVFAYDYFNCDMQQAAHGRAPAVATGIKRVCKDKVVFTYQGDGDLASIGLAEITHAAARNENITVIFVNNGIYGMTGGQMAPTTAVGKRTTTCVTGRDSASNGFPLRVCEMLATLEGSQFIARTSCHDPKHVIATEQAVKKAFRHQITGGGFSLVEVMAICPVNYRKTPHEMNIDLQENVIPYFPLGVKKEIQ